MEAQDKKIVTVPQDAFAGTFYLPVLGVHSVGDYYYAAVGVLDSKGIPVQARGVNGDMHNVVQYFVIDNREATQIDIGNTGAQSFVSPRDGEAAARLINQYSLGGISTEKTLVVPTEKMLVPYREAALQILAAFQMLSKSSSYDNLPDGYKAVVGKPLTPDAKPTDYMALWYLNIALPFLRT